MFRIPLLPMKNQNASFFICNMEKEVFILKQLYLTIKDSVKESRRVQALVGVSLFTAMNIILSGYSIRLIPEVLIISFGSLATAASGFFFGPFLKPLPDTARCRRKVCRTSWVGLPGRKGPI